MRRTDTSLNRDESLEDFDNLPSPRVIAAKIAGDLEAELEQFRAIGEPEEKVS